MKFNNHNLQIGKKVRIGKNVKLGDNTVIYDNVRIGDNTIICNDCIIGEPLNCYYYDKSYVNPPTIIGANSLIRSNTIIYADSELGDYLVTGHKVNIRERTFTGHHCMFGSYTSIQGECRIGNYNRYHSFISIGQKTETGDFVFIFPFVVLTNDPTPPSTDITGVKIGDFSQIASSSVLLPGCVIGKSCLVAANSTVGGFYPDDSFISGSPAKITGVLSKMPFFNSKNKKHYPWQTNFSKGMPWEDVGYEEWNNIE